jgi:hypothetical protein
VPGLFESPEDRAKKFVRLFKKGSPELRKLKLILSLLDASDRGELGAYT